MADEQGVRVDDFTGAVHADPAKPESRQLLSGFIGRGDGEGALRVFSDASLNHWVDVAAGDVVHSVPITDSALGGSHLWLKGDATLKPGSTAPVAGAPVGGLGADTGVFTPYGGPASPPAHTAATICTQVGVCSPLPNTHAFGCPNTSTCTPVHTLAATICAPTHVLTSCQFRPTVIPALCFPHVTQHPPCTIVATGTVGCQHDPAGHGGQVMAAQVMAPATSMAGCPNTSTCTPTAAYGCPNTSTCTPTAAFGCPDTSTCTPTAAYGCPGTSTCTPTHLAGCPNTSTCTPTHLLGCPGTSTCTPQQAGIPVTHGIVCLPTLPQHCLPVTLPHIC